MRDKLVMKIFGLGILGAVGIFLSGCVSTVTHEAMSVRSFVIESNSKYKNAISVRNILGARVTPGMLTEIKEDQIRIALSKSLNESGLLAKSDNLKKFDLDVEVSSVIQPSISADVEVAVTIYYTLSNPNFKKRFLIVGNGYAEWSEYFIAGPRVRYATERAIQNNIKNFLQEIDLDK